MQINKRREQAEKKRKSPKKIPPIMHPEELEHIADIRKLNPACLEKVLVEMGERFARTFK